MRFLSNGQWTLAKSAEDGGPAPTSLHGLIGKTHTVEVHPHVDHLYQLKGHMQTQSPTGSMKIGEIKKSKFGHLADKLPRDAKGLVTPEMIDKHITSLPKHKVQIKVVPYTMGAQQHREGSPQYTVSVGFHPDTLKTMPPHIKELWDGESYAQHQLGGHEHQIGWARIDPHKAETTESHTAFVPNEGHWHIDEIQSDFGKPDRVKRLVDNHHMPGRISANISRKTDIFRFEHEDAASLQHKSDHIAKYPELSKPYEDYKVELQAYNLKSDKFRELLDNEQDPLMRNLHRAGLHAHTVTYKDFRDEWDEHIAKVAQKIAEERSSKKITPKDLHTLFSHGHEDPMHMIHSAVNQLGRQHSVNSMSMDMPKHQAHQSQLRPLNAPMNSHDVYDQITEHISSGGVSDEQAKQHWEYYSPHAIDGNMHDINFKKVFQKLGPEGLRQFGQLVSQDQSSWLFNGAGDSQWDEVMSDGPDGEYMKNHFTPDIHKKMQEMPNDERDALGRFANTYSESVMSHLAEELGLNEDEEGNSTLEMSPDEAEYDFPVHQINTYSKRPQKLGFNVIDKKQILGDYPNDKYKQVQYAKLHKKLCEMLELLEKI